MTGKWDIPPYETTFAGAWEEGLPHGPGMMTWPEGAEYSGEFFKGRPHGCVCICVCVVLCVCVYI